MSKPKVFIGSSRESNHYVEAIQEQLSYIAEVTPWSAGAFQAQEYPMESLERQLDQNDFAVFVFSPDDIVNIRGNLTYTTRDNTLFEMGLFWGRLRRDRVFYVMSNTIPETDGVDGYHIPSDLLGLNVLKYEMRSDENYTAAVNVACASIKRKIGQLGPYKDPAKLLCEAQANTEKDYALIRLLRTFSKRMLQNPTEKYEYLCESVRSTYQVPPSYFVEGIGVWKREANDGLRQIAGNEGRRDTFYDFGVNNERQESDRIIVVDCFLQNEELVLLKNSGSYDNTYVLCYPIANQLVLTVAITGRRKLESEEIDQIFLDNHNLLDTINNIFGGAS
jgi:hypothetical protein